LRVSGKNLDIGEALRSFVQARIDATVSKYGAGPATGHVTIEPEGSGYRTDCTLHLNSGATLQADAKAQDPYASFNRTADKIEKRVRRHKKRRSDHHGAPRGEDLRGQGSAPQLELSGNGASHGAADPASSDVEILRTRKPAASSEPAQPGLNPAIIAEPSSGFREMTVSSAVLELDLTNAPVVVFRHAFDGRTNIVYRRPDGNIGWIDPHRP
jgi:ribosomal subunit interface protein